MKTKSKKNLKERAQEVFKQYDNAEKVFATSDGNVFLDKNRAQLHAGKGSITTFVRNDIEQPVSKSISKSVKKTEEITAKSGLKKVETPQKDDESKSVETRKEEKSSKNKASIKEPAQSNKKQ